MRAVGDDPEQWRAQWLALWRHCQENDLLRCWDEGVTYIAWRMQVSPPSGPGSIGKPSKLLRGTILALLEKAGCAYVPKTRDGGAPGAPAKAPDYTAEEAAEIHGVVADLKAFWDAEEAGRLGGVTPLDDIAAPDDLYPDVEEE